MRRQFSFQINGQSEKPLSEFIKSFDNHLSVEDRSSLCIATLFCSRKACVVILQAFIHYCLLGRGRGVS